MSSNIAVVGSINMDLTAYTPRIPVIGETILGHGFSMSPGGKGANQCVATAKLGARVSMIGRVGDDAFADALIMNLKKEGVDTTYVKRTPDISSGIATIIVDDPGHNSIVVVPGANMSLSPQDIVEAEHVIASADALIIQLEVPVATVEKAAQIAQEHGVKVILNPAPAQPLTSSFCSRVDVIVPNETECQLLTSMPVGNFAEAELAAQRLLDDGTKIVIVTMGERGALLVTPSFSKSIPPFLVEAVDTVAAGDAFVAAFTVAMAEGMSLSDAVTWGNAAGALTTTKYGAQEALPTRQDVEALLGDKTPQS